MIHEQSLNIDAARYEHAWSVARGALALWSRQPGPGGGFQSASRHVIQPPQPAETTWTFEHKSNVDPAKCIAATYLE